MDKVLDYDIFNSATFGISNHTVLNIALILLLVGLYLSYIFSNRFSNFIIKNNIPNRSKAFLIRRSVIFSLLLLAYGVLMIFDFDYKFFKLVNYDITIQTIIQVLLIMLLGTLLNWIVNIIYIKSNYTKLSQKSIESVDNSYVPENGTNLVKWSFYIYSAIFIIKGINKPLVLIQREIKGELFTITLVDLLSSVFVLLMAGLISWFLTNIYLYRVYTKKGIDEGAQYAVNQILRYIIFVVAFIMALKNLVSDMSIIYGGTAALLVGVGLGLQNTFNDFFSGIILLFERSVKVGDVLEIEDEVGRVMSIGLRASRIETRNNVSMLVPNSKLINESVINWTHFDNIVRFSINVGVAYGSDTNLVKKLLLESAHNVDYVLEYPSVFVRFNDFGDSSLHFTLYFFTDHIMPAENIKSALRFKVDQLFRDNNISIPFPQRDLWIKNPESLLPKI